MNEADVSEIMIRVGDAVRACPDYITQMDAPTYTRPQYEAACEAAGIAPSSDEEIAALSSDTWATEQTTAEYVAELLAERRQRRIIEDRDAGTASASLLEGLDPERSAEFAAQVRDQAPAESTYTAQAAAAYVQVEPSTWRAYVSRGQAPKADGHHDARTPYWRKSTLDTYLAGRTRKTPTQETAMAETPNFGTLTDYHTGQPIRPATEHELTYYLNAHNPHDAAQIAPGVFLLDNDGDLALYGTEGARAVTITDAPAGLDLDHPGSAENLRIMSAERAKGEPSSAHLDEL